MNLSEISKKILIRVIQDGSFRELGFLNRRAQHALTPVYDERFLKIAEDDENVACILTTEQLSRYLRKETPHAVCKSPLETFYQIHNSLLDTDFYLPRIPTSISKSAQIHPTAHIDSTDVIIGDRTYIGPKSVILSGSEIGSDCVIGPNCTIGYDGFEVRELDGKAQCIKHGGKVVIENHVDIQANCSIAKSVFNAPTTIKAHNKIGHMVFLSHGVVLKESCRIGANAVISGSSVIGENSWIGPSVTLSNGLTIGDNSFVSIGSVVVNDLPENSRVSGNFAIDHKTFLKRMLSK